MKCDHSFSVSGHSVALCVLTGILLHSCSPCHAYFSAHLLMKDVSL